MKGVTFARRRSLDRNSSKRMLRQVHMSMNECLHPYKVTSLQDRSLNADIGRCSRIKWTSGGSLPAEADASLL